MKTAAVGAQTERLGVAVAGEGFAWPQDLTGRPCWWSTVGDLSVPIVNHRSILFG
jgi:hypothetical protein